MTLQVLETSCCNLCAILSISVPGLVSHGNVDLGHAPKRKLSCPRCTPINLLTCPFTGLATYRSQLLSLPRCSGPETLVRQCVAQSTMIAFDCLGPTLQFIDVAGQSLDLLSVAGGGELDPPEPPFSPSAFHQGGFRRGGAEEGG